MSGFKTIYFIYNYLYIFYFNKIFHITDVTLNNLDFGSCKFMKRATLLMVYKMKTDLFFFILSITYLLKSVLFLCLVSRAVRD